MAAESDEVVDLEIVEGIPIRHKVLYTHLEPKEDSYDIRFLQDLDQVHTSYSFGELITRENFTAMLIDSFRIARADLSTQCFYYEYLYLKSGFNYAHTFHYLTSFGKNDFSPFNNLEPAEKDLFISAFGRYKAAHSKFSFEQMVEEFDNTIKIFCGGINYLFLGEIDQIMPLNEISQSNPQEFRDRLINYRSVKKEIAKLNA